ncbi:MAG: RDD family protein [Deltaproteobacteria bacterium]|nr:RDD family protein [Deltaproteobacteria bacterium]
MAWYYARGGQRQGPLSDSEFDSLVQQGAIKGKTLVWNPAMPDWKPLSEVLGDAGGAAGELAGGGAVCSVCSRVHPADEMVPFEEQWVCAQCKPGFVERIRQGVRPAGEMHYAGFWIRGVAKILDAFILGTINFLLVSLMVGFADVSAGPGTNMSLAFTVVLNVVSIAVPIGYSVFFVGKYGATPGKMALKLKIVMAEGSKVSYLRAFGRYFAELLSGVILGIGYIMAAFDSEKRALHDRICNTRVIHV